MLSGSFISSLKHVFNRAPGRKDASQKGGRIVLTEQEGIERRKDGDVHYIIQSRAGSKADHPIEKLVDEKSHVRETQAPRASPCDSAERMHGLKQEPSGNARILPPQAPQQLTVAHRSAEDNTDLSQGINGCIDNSHLRLSGPFANAHNFTLNNPVMIEAQTMVLSGKTVFEHLSPYTMSDAAVDSSARWPPPSCHPGTRVRIGTKLVVWLDDNSRQWRMIWLYGSAGCGKSAVAQTFAEKCADTGRLGGAFFFSRPNKRNDPQTVIPTIAYQLAVHCTDYKTLLSALISDEPQLLTKALPIQFKKLIVEPFMFLYAFRYQSVQRPFLVLLDGLDECQGEEPQCIFVKLINEVVRAQKDFPILWLICSRPEPHLESTFARLADYGREELVIDQECRSDADRYLRDGLYEIQLQYEHITGPSWPSNAHFEVLSRGASGHFIFISTALKYIGDPEYGNPFDRLEILVAFLENREEGGLTNPLENLDLLYTRILDDIPDKVWQITWKILALFIYTPRIHDSPVFFDSPQTIGNFLNIDRSIFYSAIRRLYSVLEVPPPEKAGSALRFFHASFEDFLLDPARSGKFFIDKQVVFLEITRASFYWHEIDIRHFHATYVPWKHGPHSHASLPGMKWTSETNMQNLSIKLCKFSSFCWQACQKTFQLGVREEVLSCLRDLDFKCVQIDESCLNLINDFHEQGLYGDLFRTEPSSESDNQLMDYLMMMTHQQSVSPASFPISWGTGVLGPRYREYMLMGHGERSALFWVTGGEEDGGIHRLDYGQMPSSDRVAEHQQWLKDIGWRDESFTE